MKTRPRPQTSLRKRPQQARSTALVDAILEAAVQVLAKEGAQRFTTARVAERAGTSVGSIYQYFPNKAAILFRLQADEWAATTALLRDILEDARHPPLVRLRRLVHAFVRSECAEADMRAALADAAPLYRDAPETRVAMAAGRRLFDAFMDEALSDRRRDVRRRAADVVATTLGEVGKRWSEPSHPKRTPRELRAACDALADMFAAWLERLSPALAEAGAGRAAHTRRP